MQDDVEHGRVVGDIDDVFAESVVLEGSAWEEVFESARGGTEKERRVDIEEDGIGGAEDGV
jgi:hypothetical protein